MKISPNNINFTSFREQKTQVPAKKIENKQQSQRNTDKTYDISFKSIYFDKTCDLGQVSADENNSKFLKKDALLLNEIAARYPNQDCFIVQGYHNLPKLRYREKPPEVQIFDVNMANEYTMRIDPDDTQYPAITLLLNGKDKLSLFFGMPSYVSLNPSLPFTVQAGYEVHKKLLEQKYKLLDSVGKNDFIDFGDKTVIELAHESISDVEIAVKRFLLESAYQSLTDRARPSQIYASNYPLVQTRLQDKRKFDLTTSYSKQQEIRRKNLEATKNEKNVDICEMAMKRYPDTKENQDRIKELEEFLYSKKLFIK